MCFTKVYIWPDYEWCYEDEYGTNYSHKSDDILRATVRDCPTFLDIKAIADGEDTKDRYNIVSVRPL